MGQTPKNCRTSGPGPPGPRPRALGPGPRPRAPGRALAGEIRAYMGQRENLQAPGPGPGPRPQAPGPGPGPRALAPGPDRGPQAPFKSRWLSAPVMAGTARYWETRETWKTLQKRSKSPPGHPPPKRSKNAPQTVQIPSDKWAAFGRPPIWGDWTVLGAFLERFGGGWPGGFF